MKATNPDAAAVALLKWILAGLLLLNGTALLVAVRAQSAPGGFLGGFRSNYVAGLFCALAGGLCWMLSHAATHRQDEDELTLAQPEQRGARDRAIAFGALAIMLWVASLTCFVVGCERVSWSPAEHDRKPLHAAAGHAGLSLARPSVVAPGPLTPRPPGAA